MPNLERLKELEEHLRVGTLGHKTFDFSFYNNTIENKCGTAGCAIGECPTRWPAIWTFNNIGFPVCLGNDTPLNSAMTWFDISRSDFTALFVSYGTLNKSSYEYLTCLTDNATRYEVADNLKRFIDHHEGLRKPS